MATQAERLTIVISRGERGYSAIARGFRKPVNGTTIADAHQKALNALDPPGRLLADVKIEPLDVAGDEPTPIAPEDIVALLRQLGAAGHLDLSACELKGIDLSPARLDAMGLEREFRSDLTGGISLTEPNLEYAKLDGANLQGAWLFKPFLEHARLDRACLQQAVLYEANLRGASLEDADMRDASIAGAQLTGARFFRTRLDGASLHRVRLAGVHLFDAQMDGARFFEADLQDADLRYVESAQRAYWYRARLEKTWLYRRQIEPLGDEISCLEGRGSYRAAMETYLALKANFQALGNYEDASWAYVKEQQMEKANYFPTTWGKSRMVRALRRRELTTPSKRCSCSPRALRYRAASAWLHVRLFLGLVPPGTKKRMQREFDRPRWLRNWAYELLTGYGGRPQMPVLWGLITILIFAIVFAAAGNIATGEPSLDPTPTHSPVDALTHSVAAFATIGFNTLEPVGWGARLLTAVESMMGIGFFALFIYTIGNRMSRS